MLTSDFETILTFSLSAPETRELRQIAETGVVGRNWDGVEARQALFLYGLLTIDNRLTPMGKRVAHIGRTRDDLCLD